MLGTGAVSYIKAAVYFSSRGRWFSGFLSCTLFSGYKLLRTYGRSGTWHQLPSRSHRHQSINVLLPCGCMSMENHRGRCLTSIALSTGEGASVNAQGDHTVAIVAWDTAGHVFNSTRTIHSTYTYGFYDCPPEGPGGFLHARLLQLVYDVPSVQ